MTESLPEDQPEAGSRSTLGSPAVGAGESQLRTSARNWAKEALDSWLDGSHGKTALLAPLAVEHLGKAVLWNTNPALLVPLNGEAEPSLFLLTTRPDLSSAKLRTVGLTQTLTRLDRLLGGLPIDQHRRRRLCEVRNGATHVGTEQHARYVLLDALLVLTALLEPLGEPADTFFGEHASLVGELLSARRGEVGERVATKLRNARRRLTRLEEELGQDAFQAATDRLQQIAEYELHSDAASTGVKAIRTDCPECGSSAKLLGDVDVESHPDYDVEPLGDGQYEEYISGVYWTVFFTPTALECAVCGLALDGPDELAEGSVQPGQREIEPDDLGTDFDAESYANYLYTDWD